MPGGKMCFRLLDLPAEIRNDIYSLVLTVSTKDEPIYIEERYSGMAQQPMIHGLCHVSQQLRREVVPVYRSTNYFSILRDHPTVSAIQIAKRWLAALQPEAIAQMKYLELFYDTYFQVLRGHLTSVVTLVNVPSKKDGTLVKRYKITVEDTLKREDGTRYTTRGWMEPIVNKVLSADFRMESDARHFLLHVKDVCEGLISVKPAKDV